MSPFYVDPYIKRKIHKIILPNIFLISDRPSLGLIFYRHVNTVYFTHTTTVI